MERSLQSPAVGTRRAGHSVTRRWLAVPLGLALVVIGFTGGYLAGQRAAGSAAVAAPVLQEKGEKAAETGPSDTKPPPDLDRQFQVYWQAWNFVEREHYHRPVDRTKLVQGSVKGLLGSLNDDYAAYLDPYATRVEKAAMDGLVEGIGASVEMKDHRPVIVAPVDDGPAAKAGLHTGDVILKVDGQEVGTLSQAEVVSLLRGAAGTKVKLAVQRLDDPDGAVVEMELVRARIELESVSSKMVAEGIGYIRIRVFGPQTGPQLARALRDMRARRVRGLILDLRDNPGGYVSSGLEVASQFLRENSVVLYEDRGDGQRKPEVAKGGGLATDITLAILVNHGSASASEIVASALRDHDRGILIGEQTFGKGTMQLPYDLADGSSVRVTVGTWMTPAGKPVQGQGLTPAIEAKPSLDDEKVKRDVALDKALEWFKVPIAHPPDGPPAEPTPTAGASATSTAAAQAALPGSSGARWAGVKA